jgi:hypothetical protein
MIRKLCSVFFLAFFVVIFAGLSVAQTTQTGSINGNVMDEEKNALPGVNVTIKSSALILPQLVAVTSDNGYFRFPALPPGIYEVRFDIPGFASIIRQDIRVRVGATSTVNVTMQVSEIQETVIVTGAAPDVDIQRTTLSTSLTTDFLQNVPAVRDLGAIVTMLPGISGRSSHGSPERDNSYNLDGVNLSDPVVGTQNVTFSIDIMDELTIQTGALSAEYGAVRGAAINVITKSGGNTFSGGASFYFRNDKLQSNNTMGTPLEGRFVGFKSEADAGFNLGGPIIKDKLWFFSNFTYLASRSYVSGYPWDSEINTPIDLKRLLPYVKLTFQPSVKDKFVLSYNYSGYETSHTGASQFYNVEATALRANPGHTPNFVWTRFFSSNFYTNVKVAYSSYGYDVISKTDKPLIYDTVLRRYYNGYGRTDRTVRDRFQALADGTYFMDGWLGRHEFKFGVEHQFSWETRDTTYHNDGRLGQGMGSTIYVRNGVPDYLIHNEDFIRICQISTFGAFFQDTWNPSSRLTLNLGLRFDHQEGIIPKQGENRQVVNFQGKDYDPQVYQTTKPIIWNDFSPRVGLIYDLFGDAKTLLKASFGRYVGGNIMQYFVGTNPNAFMSWRYRLNPDWTLRGDPYLFSATAGSRVDKDLTAMFTRELTVGVERALVENWRFAMRYIKKWDRNIIEDVNLNALDINELGKGNLVWTNFSPITVTDPYDGKRKTFWAVTDTSLPSINYLTNVPDANRDYDGLELTLDKRFSGKWQMMASYVWSHARGLLGTSSGDSSSITAFFNNPNVHVNAYGRSSLDSRHQFRLSGTWQAPKEIYFSGYFRYISGLPYTRVIRSQDFGLVLPQGNVSILAEEKGSRELPALAILDLRLEKSFNLGGRFGKFGLMVDMFNVLNANTKTGLETISSTASIKFEGMTSITDPRIIRVGARYQF